MTSLTDPRANATTGVPQAIASIITETERLRPFDGKRTTAASPKNLSFSDSSISPRN